jgi:hypothetical protein
MHRTGNIPCIKELKGGSDFIFEDFNSPKIIARNNVAAMRKRETCIVSPNTDGYRE